MHFYTRVGVLTIKQGVCVFLKAAWGCSVCKCVCYNMPKVRFFFYIQTFKHFVAIVKSVSWNGANTKFCLLQKNK